MKKPLHRLVSGLISVLSIMLMLSATAAPAHSGFFKRCLALLTGAPTPEQIAEMNVLGTSFRTQPKDIQKNILRRAVKHKIPLRLASANSSFTGYVQDFAWSGGDYFIRVTNHSGVVFEYHVSAIRSLDVSQTVRIESLLNIAKAAEDPYLIVFANNLGYSGSRAGTSPFRPVPRSNSKEGLDRYFADGLPPRRAKGPAIVAQSKPVELVVEPGIESPVRDSFSLTPAEPVFERSSGKSLARDVRPHDENLSARAATGIWATNRKSEVGAMVSVAKAKKRVENMEASARAEADRLAAIRRYEQSRGGLQERLENAKRSTSPKR